MFTARRVVPQDLQAKEVQMRRSVFAASLPLLLNGCYPCCARLLSHLSEALVKS